MPKWLAGLTGLLPVVLGQQRNCILVKIPDAGGSSLVDRSVVAVQVVQVINLHNTQLCKQ